mgnify:CR=1 FL=1
MGAAKRPPHDVGQVQLASEPVTAVFSHEHAEAPPCAQLAFPPARGAAHVEGLAVLRGVRLAEPSTRLPDRQPVGVAAPHDLPVGEVLDLEGPQDDPPTMQDRSFGPRADCLLYTSDAADDDTVV